jgi:DNA gyrase subunit A
VIVEKGYGKCTDFDAYPTHRRGGKGVKSINTGDRNGKVVFAAAVHRASGEAGQDPGDRGDSIMIITEQGQTIRTSVDSIRETGRVAKGVRVVDVDEDDSVVSATVIINDDEPDNAPAADAPAVEATEAPQDGDSEHEGK